MYMLFNTNNVNKQIKETAFSINELDSSNESGFKKKLENVKKIFDSKDTESGRLETRSELQKLAKEIELIENQIVTKVMDNKITIKEHSLSPT